MPVAVSAASVAAYPGVSAAMTSAAIDDAAVEAVIADALGQVVAMEPALADAEGAHADAVASIVRPAVARWIIRAATGGGRQRTATAGSFSVNESSSENISFFELSEERKLANIARYVTSASAERIEILTGGAPRYTWA